MSVSKKVVAALNNTRCLSSFDFDGLLGDKLLIFRYFKKSREKNILISGMFPFDVMWK